MVSHPVPDLTFCCLASELCCAMYLSAPLSLKCTMYVDQILYVSVVTVLTSQSNFSTVCFQCFRVSQAKFGNTVLDGVYIRVTLACHKHDMDHRH